MFSLRDGKKKKEKKKAKKFNKKKKKLVKKHWENVENCLGNIFYCQSFENCPFFYENNVPLLFQKPWLTIRTADCVPDRPEIFSYLKLNTKTVKCVSKNSEFFLFFFFLPAEKNFFQMDGKRLRMKGGNLRNIHSDWSKLSNLLEFFFFFHFFVRFVLRQRSNQKQKKTLFYLEISFYSTDLQTTPMGTMRTGIQITRFGLTVFLFSFSSILKKKKIFFERISNLWNLFFFFRFYRSPRIFLRFFSQRNLSNS